MFKNLASEIHKRLEGLQRGSRAALYSGLITACTCAVAACVVALYLLFAGTDFLLHAILTQMIYSAMQVLTLSAMVIFVVELNCCLKGR